ncbi:MAG TPA: AAA family ATPase [Chitinophagaceae bacterium]|jgi:ATP/maltotriose-dependent transcriptional regulator MalT|nr:AAA family ATPase [Chitinophagaceae bacterium]
MELIEREKFLTFLQTKFQSVAKGEGHCVFVSGEAGIGKTSLVRAFCNEVKKDCKIYQGTCDALFTPRPLAPVYDIIWQIQSDILRNSVEVTDRAVLFSSLLHELEDQMQTTLVVIEDIHWADEATLDFIKFIARRITHLRCFLIITFRDSEIHSHHPLRNVLGQLPPDSFTRLQLTPLSKQAVEKMAFERGYKGEDVYSISGGNPFYVNEILASYSLGVPDNIKDSILSVYNVLDEKTKQVWQIISVLPTGFEIEYLEKIEPLYPAAIQNCLELKILIPKEGMIFFKHELYRRTIETSLSPFVRVALNKRILDLFLENFEQKQQIERIVHHAKNANEPELVVKYAPLAAKKAAKIGAHIEASKLYFSAIEYYQGDDKDTLIQFYESYAYECYLTNQIKEAIIYMEKALKLWKEKNDIEKTGNCMRFLSRLWWNDDNSKKAEDFARQAIEILEKQPFLKAKAMAYGNMSQLKMFSDLPDECIFWGEKAIDLAKECDDNEILSYALTSVGSVQIRIPSSTQKGIELLQQSLEIALQYSYHEHVARAYTNLGYNGIIIKDNELAKKALKAGILYCEENSLDLWRIYLLTIKARLKLETGDWDEACLEAENIIKNENPPNIIKIFALTVLATIQMRRGDKEDILALLTEAKEKAFESMEPQRIIRALAASLEYEWITGQRFIEKDALDRMVKMIEQSGNIYDNSEFAFWLLKARKQHLSLKQVYEGYDVSSITKAQKAAALWKKSGSSYAQALALFEGNDDDKREAVALVHKLGANAVYQKMKLEMRSSGIKSIPRGIRKTTMSNSANLTERELDVLQLLKEGLQNKEIANKLFISAKTVDHHISSIFFKLEVNSRLKAVQEAIHLDIIK